MEFNVDEIKKLKLSSSAFNLKLMGKNDIQAITCTLKNIDDGLVDISQVDDTLVVSVTEKGSVIRTIWNSNEKRQIKICVPNGKVFEQIKIDAGVGVTKIKDITTEKLRVNCGVGMCRLLRVYSNEKTKISAGVGKVQAKNCSWDNMKLSGGVGLFQFAGNLTGYIFVSGGIGKVELTLYADKNDYEIHSKSSFFDTVRIDGASGKLYKNKTDRADAPNELHLSGGLGTIDVRFKPDEETKTAETDS